jgi:hypothetical protein
MAENKTKPTNVDVDRFLDGIEDPGRRNDCLKLAALMEDITGHKPRMWGDSIVGFGDYHYKYASGREGEWFQCGFSPRKQNLTVYVMGYLEIFEGILKDLGTYKNGKGCLYIKRLEDVDLDVLRKLIELSISKL